MFKIVRFPAKLEKFFGTLADKFLWDHFEYFRTMVLLIGFATGPRNVSSLYRHLDEREQTHRTRFNNFLLKARWDPADALATKAYDLLRLLNPGKGEIINFTIRRIEDFPEDYEFAVIFFDRTFVRYPEGGMTVRATPEEKRAAADWIASVRGGSGTCPKEPLSAALTTLGQSAAPGKRIVYLGDGGATCNGANEGNMQARTLESVAAENTEGVIIHALSIETFGIMHRNFLQALVDASGGRFVEIAL